MDQAPDTQIGPHHTPGVVCTVGAASHPGGGMYGCTPGVGVVVSLGALFGLFLLLFPVSAQAATEILRPTTFTDAAGKTTNEANAYEPATDPPPDATSPAVTVTARDAAPSVTYRVWEAKTQTYTGLLLKVHRSATGHNNDQWGIQYTVNGGANWFYLDPMSTDDPVLDTVTVDLFVDRDTLDPVDVQVRVDSEQNASPDSSSVSIYDIWTVGTYTPPSLSCFITKCRWVGIMQ